MLFWVVLMICLCLVLVVIISIGKVFSLVLVWIVLSSLMLVIIGMF